MNTLNREFAKSYFFTKKIRIEKSKIMTRTFDYIVNDLQNIDLLDIDVEGSEYDVIKKINLKKTSFKIILIEHSHFNKEAKKITKKIKNLLLKEKYKYVKNLGETSIYKNISFKRIS